jgi:hypothetical protein
MRLIAAAVIHGGVVHLPPIRRPNAIRLFQVTVLNQVLPF